MGQCEREDLRRVVAAAQRGDESAFGLLVHRYRPTAFLVALGACTDREVAEDAVQDAFLVAFRALRNLEEPGRFGPWFATIVRNRTRRLAQDRDRARSLPLHVLDGDLLRNTPSLSMPLASSGEEAIRALPEGVRESMDLYYLQEWSVGEIAALLERPVTTVKWQLHAGRALLRKRLGPQENL